MTINTHELANGLTDKLTSTKLNALQIQLILLIHRFSVGCQKKWYTMKSYSIIGERLHQDRRNVYKGMKLLLDSNIIIKSNLMTFRVNYNYNEWKIESWTEESSEWLSQEIHDSLKGVNRKPSNRQIANATRNGHIIDDHNDNGHPKYDHQDIMDINNMTNGHIKYDHQGTMDVNNMTIKPVDADSVISNLPPNKGFKEEEISKNKKDTFYANNNITLAHTAHDSYPTLSESEQQAVRVINKKCGTTWNGGIGTPHYPILQHIATFPLEILTRSVEKLKMGQRPPAMLKYLLAIMQNDNGKVTLSEEDKAERQKQNDIQYCRDLANMYRGGENDYYDHNMIIGFGRQILKYLDQYGDGFGELIGIGKEEIQEVPNG